MYKKKLDIYEIIGNIRYLQKSMNMGNIVINKNILKHNKHNNDRISFSFVFLDIFLI